MRSFYTELNIKDQTVTLAVSKYASTGTTIEKASFDWNFLGLMWYYWIAIIVGGILLIILCFFGCRKCHQAANRRGSSAYSS
jgi:hypothetical protein